jgi:secreted trypsin-like serine protease
MKHASIASTMACAILFLKSIVSSAHQVDDRELNSRIIGGTYADAKRYPYYTYLRKTLRSGSVFVCGGSLVNPDVVMTAAHCIDSNPSDPVVQIQAIVNYTQTQYFTGYEYSRMGTSYIKHRDYDSLRIVNDIGLVYLDAPVYEVSPVKLNDNSYSPSVGASVTVFGHGRISNAVTPEYSKYLMEVSIPIVSFQDCNDWNSYWGIIVDQSMICAGASSGGKGACKGDSGGPLIIRGSSASQDIQVGIVSFGSSKGCSIVNYPSVFTRVSYFKQWVQDLICLYSTVKPSSCSNVAQPTKKPIMMPIIATPPTRKPKPTSWPTPAPTKRKDRTRPPTPEPTPEPTEAPIFGSPTSPIAPVNFPSFIQAPIFNFPFFN